MSISWLHILISIFLIVAVKRILVKVEITLRIIPGLCSGYSSISRKSLECTKIKLRLMVMFLHTCLSNAGNTDDVLFPTYISTMRAIQGALIVASSVQIIMGYSQLWAILSRCMFYLFKFFVCTYFRKVTLWPLRIA